MASGGLCMAIPLVIIIQSPCLIAKVVYECKYRLMPRPSDIIISSGSFTEHMPVGCLCRRKLFGGRFYHNRNSGYRASAFEYISRRHF